MRDQRSGVPHFYADMEIIPELFKNFRIEYLAQVQDFKQKENGKLKHFGIIYY